MSSLVGAHLDTVTAHGLGEPSCEASFGYHRDVQLWYRSEWVVRSHVDWVIRLVVVVIAISGSRLGTQRSMLARAAKLHSDCTQ